MARAVDRPADLGVLAGHPSSAGCVGHHREGPGCPAWCAGRRPALRPVGRWPAPRSGPACRRRPLAVSPGCRHRVGRPIRAGGRDRISLRRRVLPADSRGGRRDHRHTCPPFGVRGPVLAGRDLCPWTGVGGTVRHGAGGARRSRRRGARRASCARTDGERAGGERAEPAQRRTLGASRSGGRSRDRCEGVAGVVAARVGRARFGHPLGRAAAWASARTAARVLGRTFGASGCQHGPGRPGAHGGRVGGGGRVGRSGAVRRRLVAGRLRLPGRAEGPGPAGRGSFGDPVRPCAHGRVTCWTVICLGGVAVWIQAGAAGGNDLLVCRGCGRAGRCRALVAAALVPKPRGLPSRGGIARGDPPGGPHAGATAGRARDKSGAQPAVPGLGTGGCRVPSALVRPDCCRSGSLCG